MSTQEKATNGKANRLPEGEFCGGTCGDCRYIEWNNDYKEYWCTFHERWVDRSEYHECKE